MAALDIALWIVTGLLAAVYLMSGLMKLKEPEKAQASSPALAAQSVQKLRTIGTLEVLGVIGVVVPFAVGILPWLSGVAAVGLGLVQVFAIPEHIKHEDTKMMPMNILILLMAAFVALGRFGVFG